MREIKFRVWNKEINKMWDFKTMERSKVFALLPDLPSKDFLVIPNSQEHTLMQYTGLKDKNGTEIYEGDIIQTKYNNLVLIKYGKTGFYPYRNKDGTYNKVTNWGCVEDGEVIGNIHDNPELLGGAE